MQSRRRKRAQWKKEEVPLNPLEMEMLSWDLSAAERLTPTSFGGRYVADSCASNIITRDLV